MNLTRLQRVLEAYPNSRTGDSIFRYLKSGDIELAKNLYFNDGDKVTQYPGLKEAIEELIGCRLHGIINCGARFCLSLQE